MSVFKFKCPSCHQHIEINAEFESRRVDCPACQKSLIVPAPPKADDVLPTATLAQPVARPKSDTPPAPITAPAKSTPGTAKAETSTAESDSPFVATATAESGSPDKRGIEPLPKPESTVPPITDMRVAVLTPALKLEIVHDVRSRLADQGHWLPGKKGVGEYNYAARREGEELVPVSATDASATHYSLFGAVLLEFHRRNVMGVTTGRREFLDQELTEAIQQVLGREPGAAPVSEADREALTHEQCLAVLDVLEKRYQGEARTEQRKEERRKIEHVRLPDLIQKLELSAPVRAEEVASALYYELAELKQRLDELEKQPKSPD